MQTSCKQTVERLFVFSLLNVSVCCLVIVMFVAQLEDATFIAFNYFNAAIHHTEFVRVVKYTLICFRYMNKIQLSFKDVGNRELLFCRFAGANPR